jgi:hypothetical protein
MSIIIKGGASGDLASVDTNKNLQVNTPLSAETAGFVTLSADNDAGEVTGNRYVLSPEVSGDYRFRVGVDQTIFNELFPGSALNTGLWTSPVTTATLTVSGGFANLNAAGSLASGAVARLTSYRHFPCYKSYTTYFEKEIQFTSTPVVNNVCEWGAFISTGTAAPTDGAFFRLNTAGEFRAVINNNGTETQSGTLDFNALVGVNSSKGFLIYVMSNKALFWIDNVLVATINAPAGQGTVTSSQNIPMSFRNYNSAAVSSAQIMKVSMLNVTLADQSTTKPWNHILCGAGGNSTQGQTSGTMGSTALYTNSMAIAAGAAMTNTTAALGSGLGGQFSALPTLAIGTDGIICSYQVPLGTSTVPGKTLYINGVNVDSSVTTVLAGNATPVVYIYSLAYGHTAVSLATTESATSKAPRRKVLGINSFGAAAAVGTLGLEVKTDFENPIVVQPGEFFQIVVKNVGAVTTTGVITFYIDVDGYFE